MFFISGANLTHALHISGKILFNKEQNMTFRTLCHFRKGSVLYPCVCIVDIKSLFKEFVDVAFNIICVFFYFFARFILKSGLSLDGSSCSILCPWFSMITSFGTCLRMMFPFLS